MFECCAAGVGLTGLALTGLATISVAVARQQACCCRWRPVLISAVSLAWQWQWHGCEHTAAAAMLLSLLLLAHQVICGRDGSCSTCQASR